MQQALVDKRFGLPFLSPESTQNPFRAKRVSRLSAMCRERSYTRIIDLGGTPQFWELWHAAFDWSRTEVLCVNLAHLEPAHPKVRCIRADATDLAMIGNDEFDLAFSNSVIEHVGRDKMPAFAAEARRVARRFYIQTPDYWFPIEAHARVPGFQWLSKEARARLLHAQSIGYFPKAASIEEAREMVRGTDLLTARELSALFPGATIHRERFMGLSKALIAAN